MAARDGDAPAVLVRDCDDKFDRVAQGLRLLEQRFDGKLEQPEQRFDGKLEHLEQRFDAKLDLWGGALLPRIDAVSTGLMTRIEAGEQRMLAELARHASAIQEAGSTQISVGGEKYADLAERVSKLEATVPRRPRRGR